MLFSKSKRHGDAAANVIKTAREYAAEDVKKRGKRSFIKLLPLLKKRNCLSLLMIHCVSFIVHQFSYESYAYGGMLTRRGVD